MQKEQKALLKLLKGLIGKFAGKSAEDIVDIIAVDKPVNEYTIADKMKLTVNQIRNILYKLSAHNLVSFIRKKDAKKGWYIYSWVMDIQKALSHFVDIKTKEIKTYEQLLHSRQTKLFYVCPTGDMETNEENAMLHSFKCQECGQLLQPKDYKEEIAELQMKIEEAKKEIAIITIEFDKLNKVREKKETRKMGREKSKRKAMRVKKAKATKKLADKLRPKLKLKRKLKPKPKIKPKHKLKLKSKSNLKTKLKLSKKKKRR